MSGFYSPLRYPGGKTRLAPFIKSVIRENDLLGIDYVEPYAGGAGVALSVLFGEYVSSITINDLDRSIYAFWHSVVHSSDRFCEKIGTTKIDVKNWRTAWDVQCNKKTANVFDLGFSTFFLNRTNISGVLRGGVIGGLKQNGSCKIDARFNKKNLIARIQKIGEFSDKITVRNQDSLALLKKITGPKFVYLDPPYVEKSARLYINSYTKENHEELAEFMQKLHGGIRWVTSYDNTQFILHSYAHCKNRLYWQHKYSTSNTPDVREIIFVASNLSTEQSQKYL